MPPTTPIRFPYRRFTEPTGIVTNLTLPSRAVVRFYNKRGTAEVAAATIKEGKQEVKSLGSSGEAKWHRPWPVEPPHTGNPTDNASSHLRM